MIPAKERACKVCQKQFTSNETTCQECKRKKKAEVKKDKPLLTQEEINALKVAKTIEPKKIVKTQEQLDKEKKKKAAIKAEKDRLKRKAKREEITEKKLDSLVSKVIRTLYGDKCCTCGKEFTYSTLHNGHFQSRQFRATRFNPQNCSSQCPSDNLYYQGLQYEYGLYLNRFHGEGTAEKMIALSKSGLKIGKVEREAIYKVYQSALEHKDLNKLIKEYYKIFEDENL